MHIMPGEPPIKLCKQLAMPCLECPLSEAARQRKDAPTVHPVSKQAAVGYPPPRDNWYRWTKIAVCQAATEQSGAQRDQCSLAGIAEAPVTELLTRCHPAVSESRVREVTDLWKDGVLLLLRPGLLVKVCCWCGKHVRNG